MPKKGEKARKIRKIKAGEGVKAPKSWWDKLMSSLRETPKYKKYSPARLRKIAGGTWAKKPKTQKIKIIKKWQK